MPGKDVKKGMYDGRYDNIMEGEYLEDMRKAMEDLAAGKITKKKYNEEKEIFLQEFPASAIPILQKEIDAAKSKKDKKKTLLTT
jgi:hypothetical protein